MLTGTPLPTLLLLSALSAACQALSAQKTAPRPPYIPPPEVDVSSEVREIHVDQFCRILPDQAQSAGAGAKLRPRKDSVICHLETVLQSSHAEERLVGNELERSVVHIEEQEYLLQNVTGYPVVFVAGLWIPILHHRRLRARRRSSGWTQCRGRLFGCTWECGMRSRRSRSQPAPWLRQSAVHTCHLLPEKKGKRLALLLALGGLSLVEEAPVLEDGDEGLAVEDVAGVDLAEEFR
jgi:hypothetical protein